MKHFLFTTTGTLGDIHPYIPIAQTLIQQGHVASIATSEEYQDVVEHAGINFFPVRPSIATLGGHEQLIKRSFHPFSGTHYLVRQVIMRHIDLLYADTLKAAKQADFLISHPLSMATPLIAEQLKKPWASTALAPFSMMSNYDPAVLTIAPWLRRTSAISPALHDILIGLIKRSIRHWEKPLQTLRQTIKLPPANNMALFEGQYSPTLHLALFDSQLARHQPDWPQNTKVCGSPMYDGTPQHTLPPRLETFLENGEPPIVFALGSSAVWLAKDFWPKAMAAVQQLGKRAIFLTGPLKPDIASNPKIRAYSYLPYSKLFPRAAAIVHQAGIGTLAHAMRAGKPQVIVPIAFDQPDNARRAKNIGIANIIPFSKVTPQNLTTALEQVIAYTNYTDAAQAIARELSINDSQSHAVNALIQAATQSPHTPKPNNHGFYTPDLVPRQIATQVKQ